MYRLYRTIQETKYYYTLGYEKDEEDNRKMVVSPVFYYEKDAFPIESLEIAKFLASIFDLEVEEFS